MPPERLVFQELLQASSSGFLTPLCCILHKEVCKAYEEAKDALELTLKQQKSVALVLNKAPSNFGCCLVVMEGKEPKERGIKLKH